MSDGSLDSDVGRHEWEADETEVRLKQGLKQEKGDNVLLI